MRSNVTNARASDMRRALEKGEHHNKNHRVVVTPTMEPSTEWCPSCPESMRCFLADRRIPVQQAIDNKYPCMLRERQVLCFYHDSLILGFNSHTNIVNDYGFWGYSITTNRAIRWYVEALADNDMIPLGAVEPAINYFRRRHHNPEQYPLMGRFEKDRGRPPGWHVEEKCSEDLL